MTNLKTIKGALISSVIALIVCFTMLLGTTFAWFTDSVTSNSNVIQTGTLKVDLELLEKDGSWTSIKESDKPIFANDKWEPGYVEVKTLKIENAGSLALKYKLVIVPNGEVSDLADVIDVYFVDSETVTRAELASLTPVGTLRDLINDPSGVDSDYLADESEKVITIALKMREEAGDEYQGKSIGTNFSVQLLATQYTYEEDSLGKDYDENAPFSMWDGVVPTEMPKTLVVDGETTTVHVKDAAAFAYLSTLTENWRAFYTDGNGSTYTNYRNGAGTNYYYSGLWTVSLEADVDLGNYPIEPVRIVLGEATGDSAFKGNNHTIRNVNTTTGLFANDNRATYADLDLVNVKATNGALTGTSRTSISNVTVENATVSGVDYVGGLVGYIYGNVKDCAVINSTVSATGKEAGGLIGYIAATASATVAHNTVNNVSVYAGNRAAGLIAQVNVNVTVCNNTIDTVTVGAEDTTTYAANEVVSNALAPENVYDNTVVNANIVSFAFAEDVAEIKNALTNGTEVIDANGAEVGAFNYALSKTNVPAGTTVTIKNAVIEGRSYGNGVDGTVIFENCTFTNTGAYSIHFDSGSGNVVFNNCTMDGWCSFGSAIKSVEMNGCTFTGNGTYALIRFYQDVTLTNCTFDCSNANTDFPEGIDMVEGYTATVINCTNVNGEMKDLFEEADIAGEDGIVIFE